MTSYAKAIFAAVGGFLAAWLMGLDDSTMTQREWVYALSQAVTLGGGVYLLPNRPAAGRPRRRNVSEQASDAGHVEQGLLIGVVVGCLGTLFLLWLTGNLAR